MFNFAMDDSPHRSRSGRSSRTQNYRMTRLKHNPYVGTFGGNSNHEGGHIIDQVMTDSRSNALVGVFRHSPEGCSLPISPSSTNVTSLTAVGGPHPAGRLRPAYNKGKAMGLKGILYAPTKPPLFSQLQVSRSSTQTQTLKYNLLASLRQMPQKKFLSTPSVGSRSSNGSLSNSNHANAASSTLLGQANGSGVLEGDSAAAGVVDADFTHSTTESSQQHQADDAPTCAICLAPFEDGDDIRSLACAHCFHKECVSEWVFHRCLSSDDLTSLNCPECRQDHVALSECGSTASNTVTGSCGVGEGICSASFLQVGQNMALEGGYDFLSDIGSDIQSPSVFSQATATSTRAVTPAGYTWRPSTPATATATTATATAGNSNRSIRSSRNSRSRSTSSEIASYNSTENENGNEDEFHANVADASIATTAATAATAAATAGASTASPDNYTHTNIEIVPRTASTAATTTATSTAATTAASTSAMAAAAEREPLCASAYSDCGQPLMSLHSNTTRPTMGMVADTIDEDSSL